MGNYFTSENYNKLVAVYRDALAAYNDAISAEINGAATTKTRKALRISVSWKNRKMGGVPSVSFMPWITCRNNDKCKHTCYAAKTCLIYPTAAAAYARNTVLWYIDSEEFQKQLFAWFEKNKPRAFRFNVAGDIPAVHTEEYLNMVFSLAHEYPETDFLMFTRDFRAVNNYLWENMDENGPRSYTDEFPENLHLHFSGAQGGRLTKKENPYCMPETIILPRGADLPEGVKLCGGKCENCSCYKTGCFASSAGDCIAFYEH